MDPLSHGESGVFTCVDFAYNIIFCMHVITNCVTCIGPYHFMLCVDCESEIKIYYYY